MNELRIKFDFTHGPIWKDKYDRENGEFYTGIPVVDNDKALKVLNEEASREYSSLYHYDEDGRYTFDEETFEQIKTDLLSLVNAIISRLNEINDGTYVVIDEETDNLMKKVS